MGCPSSVNIGDNLVFSVTTHNPATGALADADAVPAYRLYEDETATVILSGNMAKLDDANTTGFYSELIACTTANGFENGKTYTIYVSAAVGGTTGGISYGFKAQSPTLGAGASSYTATVKDVNGNVLDGVSVWVTSDSAGNTVLASGTTADNGAVTFTLDSGTYYLWCQLAGQNFTNPTTITVS